MAVNDILKSISDACELAMKESLRAPTSEDLEEQARALYDEKVLAVARKDASAWTRSVVFMRLAELALESASPPA